MMMSWLGNVSVLLVPIEGNPPLTTGFPQQKDNNAALMFSVMLAQQTVEQTSKLLVIWDMA